MLLLATVSNAQTRNAIQIDIPFAFIVQGETFDPGEYSISRASQSNPRNYILKNGDGGAIYRFRTQRVTGERSHKLNVIFNQYGDRYFLSEIWWKGNKNGRRLFPCSEEMEAREKAENGADAPQPRRVVITD